MQHELSLVAIDLAKKLFHLVGADTTGKILWRKRLTRHTLMPFMGFARDTCNFRSQRCTSGKVSLLGQHIGMLFGL